MSRIDVYTMAHLVKHQDDKKSGCAIILVATMDDMRVSIRKMSFALGDSTYNLASLQAVRLGLLSIHPRGYKLPITLHTNNNYVADVLERDGDTYKLDPKSNIEVVTEVRYWYGRIPQISLINHKFDGHINELCDVLSMDAATSQQDSDTGIREYQNAQEAGI